MFPYEEFFALLVIVPAIVLWIDNLRARETAIQAAARACAEEGWQLLDETVSGRFPKLFRRADGRLGLRREYSFEFTDTGDNRERGSLSLEGGRVIMLQLHPHLYIVPRPEDPVA